MIPVVDQSGFDKIECSRCGDCCEDFYLHQGPLQFLEKYGAQAKRATPEYRDWVNAKPWRIWRTYDESGYHPVKGRCDSQNDLDGLASMMWYGELLPTRQEDGSFKAACPRFQRDYDGNGTCTIYASRPAMCADFPYGSGQVGYERCTWNVELLEYEPWL